MSQRDTLVHLFAGGCGGTVGAILTCPLEVVKTRLQSSHVTFYISDVQLSTVNGASVARMSPPGPIHCLKLILEREGPRSLFRGLGPNLVGVAPSRVHRHYCHQSDLADQDTPAAGCQKPGRAPHERLRVRAAGVPGGRPARLLPRHVGLLRRHLGDGHPLRHLREHQAAPAAVQGPGQHGRRGGDGQGRLRLCRHDAGRRHLQDLRHLVSLPTRGDPDAATRGGHQVPLLLPDPDPGAAGGGLPRAVPRPHHTPRQADPQHGHHDGHLRTGRLPAAQLAAFPSWRLSDTGSSQQLFSGQK
uniref:Solute carrier family 25 member 36a n=1 Tax=Gadus morhua TaxID=8049 RepID=A0A8C5A2F7_GADMO